MQVLVRPDQGLELDPPVLIFTKIRNVRSDRNSRMRIKLRAFKKGRFNDEREARMVAKTIEVPVNRETRDRVHVYEWAERG